jgi:hypothetical protein
MLDKGDRILYREGNVWLEVEEVYEKHYLLSYYTGPWEGLCFVVPHKAVVFPDLDEEGKDPADYWKDV